MAWVLIAAQHVTVRLSGSNDTHTTQNGMLRMVASISQQSQFLRAGLNKALAAECRSILAYYIDRIEQEPLTYPEHIQEWRRGSFSWVYVRGVEYWSTQLFNTLESMMAAKRGRNGNKKATLENYSFVRCELTSEDKKAAKVWIAENLSDMGPMLHDVMAENYKFSCSFSQDHDTFTATLTGKEGSINEFKTLTARHADWLTAAMTVLYKHGVMFAAKVWETDSEEDDGWS